MTDLVILVPSRGRPAAAHELLDVVNATVSPFSPVALRFIVDEGDETAGSYPIDHTWVVPGGSMVIALNEGSQMALDVFPDAKAFAFMGDDHRPRTVDWDRSYIEALDAMGGTGLVYGNDLLQGARIPTQGLLSTDIIRALGWFAPPGFRHLYVDDAWLAIGNAINRTTYLPNVVVEHVHPMGGQVAWDEGYERVNSTEVASHDQLEFHRWREQDLRAIKDVLLELL